MKLDLTAKMQVKEGREGCEFAIDFAGPIKNCDYRGCCDSQIQFGNGIFCDYGITKFEGKPADARVACTKTNSNSLVQKLVE